MRDRFLKECGVTARAATYLIFCLVLAAVFFFQYRTAVSYDLLEKPTPGTGDYGTVNAEIPEQVQRNMTYRLYRDMVNNRYDTYRLGILTNKSLKYEDRQKVLDIFEKIAGESFYDVDAEFYKMDLDKVMTDRSMTRKQAGEYLSKVYYKQLRNEFVSGEATTRLFNYEEYMPVNGSLSYDEFKKEIAGLRKIIGGHSDDYSNFKKYGSVPVTYEEALSRYETMVYKDGVSGAYARLFCDAMGVVAGILPALIAWEIFRGGFRRKKRDDAEVWIRFFAITFMSMLPILILAVAATLELSFGVRPIGLSADYFAFVGYSLLWLLPTTAFAASVGLFFTVVTKRSVGIWVQLVIWYWSVSLWTGDGLEPVKYGASMFLRHSLIGAYDIYSDSLGGILINRAVYLLAALVLTAAAWYAKDRQLRLPAVPQVRRKRAV